MISTKATRNKVRPTSNPLENSLTAQPDPGAVGSRALHRHNRFVCMGKSQNNGHF